MNEEYFFENKSIMSRAFLILYGYYLIFCKKNKMIFGHTYIFGLKVIRPNLSAHINSSPMGIGKGQN
jgi:hypothetical protein